MNENKWSNADLEILQHITIFLNVPVDAHRKPSIDFVLAARGGNDEYVPLVSICIVLYSPACVCFLLVVVSAEAQFASWLIDIFFRVLLQLQYLF